MCAFVLCRDGIGGQLLGTSAHFLKSKLCQSIKFSIPHDLLCEFTHSSCRIIRRKAFELDATAMASLHESESPAI